MPIARSGVLWRRIFVILLIATGASYFYYQSKEFPHGGTRWGLAYGIAGLLLILLLAFFGVRKRWYRSTWGTVEQWLQSHIWLGVLALIVLVFHTGMRFHDKIAVTTLVLTAIVVLSGIFGAVLYATVPRMLTEVESNLTVEEISDNLNQLAGRMARIASGRSAPFQKIHDQLIRESRPGLMAGWRLLLARMRRRSQQKGEWENLLRLVPKEEQQELQELLVASRQRKEFLLRLIYQQRYKNILEFWLYIHVPFTIALLVFAVLHLVGVFYYGRIVW